MNSEFWNAATWLLYIVIAALVLYGVFGALMMGVIATIWRRIFKENREFEKRWGWRRKNPKENR